MASKQARLLFALAELTDRGMAQRPRQSGEQLEALARDCRRQDGGSEGVSQASDRLRRGKRGQRGDNAFARSLRLIAHGCKRRAEPFEQGLPVTLKTSGRAPARADEAAQVDQELPAKA